MTQENVPVLCHTCVTPCVTELAHFNILINNNILKFVPGNVTQDTKKAKIRHLIFGIRVNPILIDFRV